MPHTKFDAPRKANAKECNDYRAIALTSHTRKVVDTVLQQEVLLCVEKETPSVQGGFRKRRGTKDCIANVHCLLEFTKEFHEEIHFVLCRLQGSP